MIALITRRDTGSNDARSSPDLGIETPEIETTEEASRCELGGGLRPKRTKLAGMVCGLHQQFMLKNGQESTRRQPRVLMHRTLVQVIAGQAGTEISSMRTIGGSTEENFEVSLMVAEDGEADSDPNESNGAEPDHSSAAFHDPLLEEDTSRKTSTHRCVRATTGTE